MMRRAIMKTGVVILVLAAAAPAARKAPTAYPTEPGDPAIHEYLTRLAVQLDAQFTETLPPAELWNHVRNTWKQQFLYMMGLDPMPPRSPLNPVITGTLQRDGYVVDKLYFESLPNLYVTANLYRPADLPQGTRLPAVLYVCGHGNRGPEGVKVGYQSQPIWFAKHGYACLIVDTVDRAEIKGVHRGLYSEGRRWWLSRGYTPGGVECWNGIRAIDYLVSRPDIDPDRIAVTGISGGGASTFWIAAADERVKAAVPISGMSDLQEYVGHNGTDHHCDCMFMPNTFAWPWTRIAALVAPRPVLFINSDQDYFFPLDGDERIINRLERLYAILGAGDMVDAVVSVGGHDYRKDIRQATCRFINTHLNNNPAVVTDTEQDLAIDKDDKKNYPIDPKDLCVFPDGKGIPSGAINATIDEHFVPVAAVEPPAAGRYDTWRQKILSELRRVPFRPLPDPVPPAEHLGDASPTTSRLSSEDGIEFRLATCLDDRPSPRRTVLLVSLDPAANPNQPPEWLRQAVMEDDLVDVCMPRGIGDTRWNTQSPPNRIERQFALVGSTVDTGRVRDVIAAVRYLKQRRPDTAILVAGDKTAGLLAAYAALLDPDIAGAIVHSPPATHMAPAAPQFLNVLRVCDVPETLGMIAPRALTLIAGPEALAAKVKTIYTVAGATDRLILK
ncbi:MAG TPA: prolyl oligopeptidase family serine peptidase [Phycisphaerae bacterium]|nr:prolyl oligopeptidase family serine peptidase [Phycisphaerae bacterium]